MIDIMSLLKVLPIDKMMAEYTKAQAADCKRKLQLVSLIAEGMDSDGKVDGRELIKSLLDSNSPVTDAIDEVM